MSDLITLTGVVATKPRHIVTNNGLDITSFRLASGQRRFDREKQRWVEAETNWYTVTGFRQLAQNLATSIELGQRVVVSGRMRIRAWENAEKSGTTIEVEADSVGHDLSWGTSVWVKSMAASTVDGTSGEKWAGEAVAAAGDVLPFAACTGGEGEGAGESLPDARAAGSAQADDEASALVPF